MHHWKCFKFSSFLESIGKNMFGVVISAVKFGRGLVCYSNLFYIHDKEETNLIDRSTYLSLCLFLKIY